MKFSFAWLTKRFRRKSTAETGAADDADEQAIEVSEAEVTEADKPKTRFLAGLIGRFKRKADSAEEKVEADARDLPTEVILSDAVPASGKAGAEPVSKVNPAAEDGGEAAPHKPALRVRLSRLYSGLVARFRRKSQRPSNSGEADAADLFSWSEGDALPPEADAAATTVAAKRRPEPVAEGGEEEEERSRPNLLTMIRLLLRKKIVVLGLLLLIVLIAIVSTGVVLYQIRASERAKLEALEKKNKQLEAENKKLQAAKKNALIKPVPVKGNEPQSIPNKSAEAGGTDQPQNANKKPAQSTTGDCAVTNKENAAAVLKKCIEEFNAMDHR